MFVRIVRGDRNVRDAQVFQFQRNLYREPVDFLRHHGVHECIRNAIRNEERFAGQSPGKYDDGPAIGKHVGRMKAFRRIAEPIDGGDPAEVDSWQPVDSPNELCENCHSREGRHNRIEFQSFGKVMDKKGVECVDCHMAKVPNDCDTTQPRETHAHDMGVKGSVDAECLDGEVVTVEDKEQYSCLGCHDNKTKEWALKQIEKQKMHVKSKD